MRAARRTCLTSGCGSVSRDMPTRREIGFAGSAIADLEDIRAWYAELGVPEVGECLLREIISQV